MTKLPAATPEVSPEAQTPDERKVCPKCHAFGVHFPDCPNNPTRALMQKCPVCRVHDTHHECLRGDCPNAPPAAAQKERISETPKSLNQNVRAEAVGIAERVKRVQQTEGIMPPLHVLDIAGLARGVLLFNAEIIRLESELSSLRQDKRRLEAENARLQEIARDNYDSYEMQKAMRGFEENRLSFASEYLDGISFTGPVTKRITVCEWFIGDGGSSFKTEGDTFRQAIDKAMEQCGELAPILDLQSAAADSVSPQPPKGAAE